MKLSQQQVQDITKQLSRSKQATKLLPFHGVWYNKYNFKFEFLVREKVRVDNTMPHGKSGWHWASKVQQTGHSIVQELNNADSDFDFRSRMEVDLGIFTSDVALIDFLTNHNEIKKYNYRLHYTSDDYFGGLLQLDNVPTDVKIVTKFDPDKKYKIYFKYLRKKDQGVCHALASYIQSNPEHFTCPSDTIIRRLQRGVLWGDEYVYCNDQDTVMMMYFMAPELIKKVYQQMEKNKNAE